MIFGRLQDNTMCTVCVCAYAKLIQIGIKITNFQESSIISKSGLKYQLLADHNRGVCICFSLRTRTPSTLAGHAAQPLMGDLTLSSQILLARLNHEATLGFASEQHGLVGKDFNELDWEIDAFGIGSIHLVPQTPSCLGRVALECGGYDC